MRIPQFCAGLLFFALNLTYAQNQSLTTLPTGLCCGHKSDLKAALNTDGNQLLLKAFEIAELEEILGQSGPFTVFAPTNDAFNHLSQEELADLFKLENRKKLKDILTYHMVAGNISAAKILQSLCRGEGKTSFTTLQGSKIWATISGTDIILTDSLGNKAKITTADTNRDNGVIHQIDHIILPSGE